MAFEAKPNTGQLFENTDKRPPRQGTGADGSTYMINDPEFSGSALVNGVSYYVDAYQRKAKNGNTYFALKFKPKNQRAPAAAPKVANGENFVDDEIPY